MKTPLLQTARPIAWRASAGFTLIELMVGMVLALLTTVIIAQVMINAEGQKRTTTTGTDAQVNGAVGLYSLTRELQMAGYGVVGNTASLGCPVRAKYGSAAAMSMTLAPVVIVPAAGDAPLRIRVLSSGRNSFAVPVSLSADHGKSATSFTVNSSMGVSAGDVMLAIPQGWDANNWCTMFQVATSGSTTLTDTTIPHGAPTSGSNWNQAAADSIMPDNGYLDGSVLVNLGALNFAEYSVVNGNLQVQTMNADGTMGAATVIASQVMRMEAFYGRDTSATRDGVIDVYDQTAPTTADGWSRVLAIRIALVTRSDQREKTAVTTADPTWNVGAATAVTGADDCASGTGQCLTLQVSPDAVPVDPQATDPPPAPDTEWQHYRYKVFDTVVPLRNVLWTSS